MSGGTLYWSTTGMNSGQKETRKDFARQVGFRMQTLFRCRVRYWPSQSPVASRWLSSPQNIVSVWNIAPPGGLEREAIPFRQRIVKSRFREQNREILCSQRGKVCYKPRSYKRRDYALTLRRGKCVLLPVWCAPAGLARQSIP